MKLNVLGLNHFASRSATCPTVTPRSFARSSGHFRMAPPHSSSARPKLSRYQAARRSWSDVDLKKTPPIPVTRAIAISSSVFHQRLKACAASLSSTVTAAGLTLEDRPAGQAHSLSGHLRIAGDAVAESALAG